MLALLVLTLAQAHATECPTIDAEPVKLKRLAAMCMGDETKVYAARRDGDHFWVKRISVTLTADQRAKAAVVGEEVLASSFSGKGVYMMWDPPVNAKSYAKVLLVDQSFEALR